MRPPRYNVFTTWPELVDADYNKPMAIKLYGAQKTTCKRLCTHTKTHILYLSNECQNLMMQNIVWLLVTLDNNKMRIKYAHLLVWL